MGKALQKLLIICGPTATGKTDLALQLIKVFDGEIISADSRQVYKGMDIGTGKDKPENTEIWGYDLVDPKNDFNVSEYQKTAREIIQNIWSRNKLPILVGGSGFYIKAVVDGVASIDVTVDSYLRETLQGKSAYYLFNILAKINPQRASKMNKSDRNNPRRLIRAIEIYSNIDPLEDEKQDDFNSDSLFVGLTTKSDILKKRIIKRVNKRLKQGMEQEVENLVRSSISWDSQALNTIGYKYWQGFFRGEFGIERLKQDWITDEYQYSKRQMTWFKKDSRIHWFDISERGYNESVAKLVKKWYK